VRPGETVDPKIAAAEKPATPKVVQASR